MTDFESSPTPFYAHMMRGWGGFVNVLERMTMDQHRMSDHYRVELQSIINRLQLIVDAQKELK